MLSEKKRLEWNIWLSYLATSFGWMRFYIPLLALFYIASGVPLDEFAIIMSVVALVVLLFEVPSGVLADILGKKKTIVIGRAMFIGQIYLLAFHNGFWPFLISGIIAAIGMGLVSGAEEALLYDTLKKLKRTDEHKRISGNVLTARYVTIAATFMAGGILFHIDPKLPAICALPPIIIATIISALFVEPYHSKKRLGLMDSLKHLKEGLKYFAGHSYVKFIVFFSLPVFTIIGISLSMSSAYLSAVMIPVTLIGVVAFLQAMTSAVSSKRAHNIEERLGEKKTIYFIGGLSILAALLMGLMVPGFGMLFYLIIPFVSGGFHVLTNHYVNEHIETSHRATMLSIKSMFSNLGVFIMFPLVGKMTETFSMRTGYWLLAVVFAGYFIVLYFRSSKWRLSQLD